MLKFLSVFKSLVDYKIKGSPFLAGFKITSKCNLKCRHCPFWKISTPDMTFDEVKKVLKKLSMSGAKLIIFEGGEPTLWKDGENDFNSVLKFAKTLFLSVNFTTNGLSGFEYDADAIWVSFDGLKESHDFIRGDGVFEKVVDKLKQFRKKRIFSAKKRKIFANICINSINWKEIPALCIFLSKLVDGITVQFYYPYEKDFSLYLERDKRVKVLNRLIYLKRKGIPILDSVDCLNALKYNLWKCHPELLINAENDGRITQGCYIKNRGEINCTYCGFAAHVELSRAFDLKLSSILTGIKVFLI